MFLQSVASPSITSDPWFREAKGVARDGRARLQHLRGREMKTFIKMLKNDSGASAAEYALILAIIGSVIAIAALALSNAIGGAMDNTAACINTPTSDVCDRS
jgi:pilus assembly protein Flp/PilA